MAFGHIAQTVVGVLAVAGVYGFVLTAQDSETRRACSALCSLKPDYAARNRLAPDFELPDLDGKKVKLSSFRGRTVILNFWTKTCRPCLEEMPSLAGLAKALRPHPDIAFITITTDESAADAKDTLRSVMSGSSEIPFLVLIDPEGDVVQGKFGTKLFPETWFIDAKGIIRARFDGPREWDGALPLDLAKSLSAPIPCEVTYSSGEPRGPLAALCGDIAPGG
jgi:thiol-disulfide isomerase/thioredoxin